MPKERLSQAEATIEKLLNVHPAHPLEIVLSSNENSLTRFANNTIHQNLYENKIEISIRPIHGKKTARVSTNNFTQIDTMIRRAEELTRMRPDDPHLMDLAHPQKYKTVQHFCSSTDTLSPQLRAENIRSVINHANENKLETAGILANSSTDYYFANSEGLKAHHKGTLATFSVTMMGENSSGWAKESHKNIDEISIIDLAKRASQKAIMSKNPTDLKPGKYTVILEPSAVVDLFEFFLLDFGLLSVIEKRSCFNDKLNKKIFGSNITLQDNVYHPDHVGHPFDGEGFPRQSVNLVEEGILKNFVSSQSSAKRMDQHPTGHGFPLPNSWGEAPVNLVMFGETTSIDEMIQSLEEGVLVSRVWYIREVDPMQKILTGMTRDGTFLIKNGKISKGIKNLRFNVSLFHLLNHVVALSPALRASGEEGSDMVVPALMIEGFPFSSSTLH